MKPRVIDGKRYNPQTANLIGEKDGLTLYRKKTGEYFATENDEYLLLGNEQAKEIGKKILDDRSYQFEFEIRDDEDINLSLLVPRSIYDKVFERAQRDGKPIKETVREILFDTLF